MQLKQVNQEFYVADQISQPDVAELANKGIKTIICNRPDGEGLINLISLKYKK